MKRIIEAKDMIPISINEFIAGVKNPVDIYVRLSEGRFICIAKAGQETQKDQLKSYQNKELQYLWVRRSEYGKITHQTVTVAGILIGKESLDLKVKSSVMNAAAQSVFRQFDLLGISLEAYGNAKIITEATVALVESHKDLAALIEGIKSQSDSLLAHSMAVSTFSVLMGIQMGWEKKVTLEKLALGGLLHDIGLKAIPGDLLKKPTALMTPEEIQIYETHAFKGMQMMLSLGIVPDDIVSIVYEHHENSIGQGYPQRIRDIKIHPLAKIVGLADQFCDLIIAGVNCPVPKNPREALMYIEHTMGQPFNKDAFKALSAVVGGDAKGKAS